MLPRPLHRLFDEALNSDTINQQLMNEITYVRQLPINGFPSLVLAKKNQFIPIELNYTNWQVSYDSIMAHM